MLPVSESRGRGIFVTGTDTGVGKTLAAAALARFLANQGVRVGVMKPVESGVADPARLGEDGALLRWASGCDAPVQLIGPCRLKAPVAPSLAAELAGIPVDIDGLVAAARQLLERYEFLIVEGAGGLMVPLQDAFLVGDLACRLGLPLVTVCRPGLGTINHTLLTLQAARCWGLRLAGLIISGMPAEPDLAERHAPSMLAELSGVEVLQVLPRVPGEARHKVVALSRQFTPTILDKIL